MGLFGALGAIAPGLTDWRDRYGFERRVGLNHALFNASATILSLVSFLLRLIAGPGDRIAAAILGSVGLVFTKGTGVNHTAWEWEAADEDDEAVLPLERVEEHTRYRLTASGVPVVLLRQVRSSLSSQRRVSMLAALWMKEYPRVSRGVSLAWLSFLPAQWSGAHDSVDGKLPMLRRAGSAIDRSRPNIREKLQKKEQSYEE